MWLAFVIKNQIKVFLRGQPEHSTLGVERLVFVEVANFLSNEKCALLVFIKDGSIYVVKLVLFPEYVLVRILDLKNSEFIEAKSIGTSCSFNI